MYLRRLALMVVTIAMIMVDECDCCFGDVFALNVKHKFGGKQKNLSTMKDHDIRRHARILSTVNVDIPLGGNGHVSADGLYYAKVKIGNPSEEYHVQVDTGVDLFWVDCAGCDKCVQKSYLNIELKKYDLKKSNTSSLVYCNNEFCSTVHDGKIPKCKPDQLCKYNALYPDNSGSTGYLVNDTVELQQVTGNLQTGATNETIIFGCGNTRRYGNSDTTEGDVDGVLGFGQGNSSVISQLAANGKVKRKFAHCLNNVNGGGIFAIGEVMTPQLNTTRMIKKQYKIQLREMQIGNTTIELGGEENRVHLDSGSSLGYLPTKIYKELIEKITSRPSLKLDKGDNFTCFTFDKNLDDEFPIIKFTFTDSLDLKVYPHDYLFESDEKWCIGWLQSEMNAEGSHILLGDMVLANKLVVYDIENQTIGWTDYKCGSDIKVMEENAGTQFNVGSHNLGSASSLHITGILKLFSILISLLHFSLAYSRY